MSGRVLAGLGLLDAVDTDALSARSLSFASVHLGTRDVPIGTLLDLVHGDAALLPPRTGHLGNWEDIALGRSGPMDFNAAICGGGYGYPLIYGFTRTETEARGETAAEGDTVYLPGSLVDRGDRRVLPLYTWDGRAFVRRDRSRPLFCPFVATEIDGGLVPLVELHWRRMGTVAGYRFALEASAVMAHAEAFTAMLGHLLQEAAARPNPRPALSNLVSHAVRPDGLVGRCELLPEGRGFRLDGHLYGSADALAEAALEPFRALTDPQELPSRIGALPPVLPVVSHLLTSVLTGLFGTHHPDGPPGDGIEPYITHLHWGARATAGCPPRRGGYFSSRTTVRGMRAIASALTTAFPEAAPLCVVLLPAPVFMLCPADTDPRDAELLAALFRTVRAADPDDAYPTALGWLGEHGGKFSGYLRGRFRDGSGVPHDGILREPSTPVQPEGFREMTFRQASAMVAAFEEVANA